MGTVVAILVGIVALEHLYFLYLEMFMWTKPVALRAFGTTQEFAEASRTLAANQGLYNGFLAAGLIWSLVHPDLVFRHQLQIFFLVCVIIAAAYGAYSVKPRILLIQGLPAIFALVAVLLS
jgi:putative membrane protein